MAAMWLIPFLCLGWLGAVLIAGAHHSAPVRAIEEEAQLLVREERIAALRQRLREQPSPVLAIRKPFRLRGHSNGIALDMGAQVLDAWCYLPPQKSIAKLCAVNFDNDVGWVVETDGPDGPARLYAWLLDVRPAA